jgi:O-antigen/teichoic acid export membrane protein
MPANPTRALLARGSIYTVALGLQLSAALVTLPIVTRLLSVEEYGVVALALLVQLVAAVIGSGGLPAAVTRAYFDTVDGPGASRRLIASGVIPALAFVAVAELTSSIWMPELVAGNETGALHIAVWTCVPAVLVSLCLGYLRAAERARTYVTVTVAAGVGGQVAGLSLVAIVPGAGATEYIAGVGGGFVLAAALGLLSIRPWHSGPASVSELHAGLALGVPTVAHGLGWTLLALGDRAVIRVIDGSAAVGRYQVAYTVGALGLTLLQAVSNAWTPIVFGARDEERWQVQATTSSALLLLAALVAGALAFGGPVALNYATPGSYHHGDLAAVIAIVSVSALPFVVYNTGCQVLIWSKRTIPLGVITCVVALANLALVAVLVPPLGLRGAAFATLIAYVLEAVWVIRAARPLADLPRLTRRVPLAWTLGGSLAIAGGLVPVTGMWILGRAMCTAAIAVGFVVIVRRLISSDPAHGVAPAYAPPAP